MLSAELAAERRIRMNADDAPLVLVADDDPDLLELVEFRLERSGYRVARARDGQEALDVALEQRPALAVLDVMMPKLDGYEVVRQLRAHPETARMPVILLTARVQEADVSKGFEVGADDYIRKPFSPQELRARVQAILGRR
jgi:DNA-binding response OmpR family regulator